MSDIYEPGSTFKLVTIAGALEEKLTRPDEVFDCQMGSIVINGMRIRDHKPLRSAAGFGVLAEFERRGRDQDRACGLEKTVFTSTFARSDLASRPELSCRAKPVG